MVVGMPSYRIKHQVLQKNDQTLRENLDFLHEIRLKAELKAALYRDRISKAYNRKVLERPLDVGDLFLRRTAATGKVHAEGKLTANSEGPYIIAKKLAPGSFILKAWMAKNLETIGMIVL